MARLDWAALGAAFGKKLGEEVESRGLVEKGQKLIDAARPYLPADVAAQLTRAEALVALGFSPLDTPTPEQIGAAYKEIARTCHPDKTKDAAAHDRFKAATAARDALQRSQ